MIDESALLYKRLRSISLRQPARDRKYLNWVKTKPCIRDGKPSDDPHHIFGSTMGSNKHSKSSDYHVVPVCRECHNYYEANPRENWALVPEVFRLMTEYLSDVK